MKATSKADKTGAPAAAASGGKAAIARENGAKGGRPRSRLSADVIAQLGDPPRDPLARARWNGEVLATVTVLLLRGEIDRGLAAEIRATVGLSVRALPTDVILELERLLREGREAQAATEPGPQLEEVRDAQSKPTVRRSAG